MARPNNFWDVLSQTADYASEAIPAAQRQNQQMAQERERFGLRAQQEQDQLGETRRYHDQMIGLRSANRPASPTAHPNWSQFKADVIGHPEKYDPDIVERVMELEDRPGPQTKTPPNFIGDISNAADLAVGRNAGLRQKEGTTTIIPGQNGGPSTYAPPTTPVLTRDQALQQQFDLRSGMMPQYNVKPDSVRAGLGLRPNVPTVRPSGPMARPQTNAAPGWGGGGLDTMGGGQQDLSTLSDEELDALERQITGQ